MMLAKACCLLEVIVQTAAHVEIRSFRIAFI